MVEAEGLSLTELGDKPPAGAEGLLLPELLGDGALVPGEGLLVAASLRQISNPDALTEKGSVRGNRVRAARSAL